MRGQITFLLAFAAVGLAGVGPAQAGMQRVSVATGGAQANGPSADVDVSANGRFVVFTSSATNLVAGDTNNASDVFIRDRKLGTTKLISLSTNGARGKGDSDLPSLSPDGRFVAFVSLASNLVPGDTNGTYDVFVRDRQTGTTRRASLGPGSSQAVNGGLNPSISADGRFVAFSSSRLLPGDTSNKSNVYVRDLQKNSTELASVATDGTRSDGFNFGPTISADGRYVGFSSDASNLVQPDRLGTYNVFVRDRQAKTTKRVDRALDGGLPNGGDGRAPKLSTDSRFVAFPSDASNLVAGDSNGQYDIFVFDRRTATTRLATLSTSGVQSNNDTIELFDLSADGRYVAFYTRASNLVPGVNGFTPQIYLRDLEANTTLLVSAGPGGAQANGRFTDRAATSQHGRVIGFSSDATNLVPHDTNGMRDVFVQVYPAPSP